MCLAVPMQVKSLRGKEATVEVGGITRKVSLVLAPEAKQGDYVLVHTGYAISVIDEEEAQETLELLGALSEVY